MLVVLLALRAVDCRVKRSFHGWFCVDIIADFHCMPSNRYPARNAV